MRFCSRSITILLFLWVLTACAPIVSPTEPWHNSIYLEHDWVDQEPSEAKVKELLTHLHAVHADTVFLHVGPLEADGTIPADRSPYAEEIVNMLKKKDPNLHIQAWIGQKEARGGGVLDLRDRNVRGRIVETAVQYADLGFDGIHLNIEPLITEDNSLEILLKDIKKSIGDHTLSMAIIPLEPVGGIHDISKLWRGGDGMFLSPEEFSRLSSHVDQVMVMAYDTGLQEPLFYTTFVSLATQRFLEDQESQVKFFIGIPTYEDKRDNFNPDVENLTTAILGVQNGLEASGTKPTFLGVGIYAHWTTDEAEWKELESLLNPR